MKKANNGMLALVMVLGFVSSSFAKTTNEVPQAMRDYNASAPRQGVLPPCLKEAGCNSEDPQFKSTASRIPSGAPVADGQTEMVWCEKCGKYIPGPLRLADNTTGYASTHAADERPEGEQ